MLRTCRARTLRAALGAIAIAASCAAARAAETPLATLAVAYEKAPRERAWDGTVEAVNQATVSAQTSGRVAEILYDVDDFVPAGAVIMRFTDTEQRAALDAAHAALTEVEAAFAQADSEFTRVATMFANGTVAKARYDQARASHDGTQARLAAAQAGVKTAEEQLGYTVVRAPYAGIVSKRHVQVGELVRPGQPLMSGLSLENVRVNVDVPQSMLEPIRKIGKATVHLGDRDLAAASLTFFPVAETASNTFRVRVNLPATGEPLYPGMFVKVGFVVGDAERLLVPESAIVHRSEVTAVYVVAPPSAGSGDHAADATAAGDRVLLRQIRIGRQYGDRIEVLAGLDAGERIATDPVAAGVFAQERRSR